MAEEQKWTRNVEKRAESADQIVRRFWPSDQGFQDFLLDGETRVGGEHLLMFRFLWDDDEGTVLLERFSRGGGSDGGEPAYKGCSSVLNGYLLAEDGLGEIDWDTEVRRFHGGGKP